MSKQTFDPSILSDDDRNRAFAYVGVRLFEPDVTLAPDGTPYLYRWHLAYDNQQGNEFLHIQVLSDPERPFHDHPWDNKSVIISGGYDELFWPASQPMLNGKPFHFQRSLRKGDSVAREAEVAHRLLLPEDIPYAMTRFSTGPKRREWGFWYPDGWHHNKRHVDDRPTGISYGKHEP